MPGIDEIHRFCDNLNKKHLRWYFIGIVLGGVFIVLLGMMFFNGNIGLIDKKRGEVSVLPKKTYYLANESDPQNSTVETYHMWYAPPNSFGIQETKSVNWSWFWKVFKKNSAWQLEAWHLVQQVWVDNWQGQNLNEWLNITRVRSESNSSEKITLNVTNMHPSQDLYFRFKFGIDIRVKNYVNKSSWYEYTLAYPANETENYTVFFNFSDVKPLIQNGVLLQKHGVKGDLFYFILTQNQSRNPLGSGKSFEIDPWFGTQTDTNNLGRNANWIYGTTFMMGATGGTADDIACKFLGDESVKLMYIIYNNATNALVGQTIEHDGLRTAGWFSLAIDGSVSLTADTEYVLCFWSDNSPTVRYDSNTAWERNEYEGYDGNPPSSLSDTGSSYEYSIYCNYTVSAGEEPSWNNPFDWVFSFSNTTSYENVFDFNFSFSNTSIRSWTNPFDFVFSFGNTTTFVNSFAFNFSFSNTSIRSWTNPFDFVFSFGNTTTFVNSFAFNFSFSNSSEIIITITNPFPSNSSFNAPLQPTIYATINHTGGQTMNVSWYWGTIEGNENTLIGSDNNFTNSTQNELFFEATNRTTVYYWRVQADDGTNYENVTFSFTTEGLPSGQTIGVNKGILYMSYMLAMISFVLIMFFVFNKKKEKKIRR